MAAGTKLDLSNVKLHLVTPEGQVKYSTDCAPTGYYIIPVRIVFRHTLEFS